MRKAVTIRDVAREAGVSVAVVSRVLNDGSGPVASLTRARVVETIERLQYQPRAAARELQQRSRSSIGLMLADLSNPFFARLADRVVWEARARGTHALLLTTQEDASLEAESLDSLVSRSVGAIIATPTGENLDRWRRLIDLGVHIIFVDREIDALPQLDVVAISNKESAGEATRHLLALGHERIALISGPENTSTGRERIAGFRHSMAEAGMQVDGHLVRAIPFRGDTGGDAIGAMLALPDPPTAIIVGNTAQVRSALMRVKRMAIDVPNDLSLIVFDDNPWTELVSPPLSSVRQPIDLLAHHCVDLAVRRMQGTIADSPRRVRVDAEFVQRLSSGPPGPAPRAGRGPRPGVA